MFNLTSDFLQYKLKHNTIKRSSYQAGTSIVKLQGTSEKGFWQYTLVAIKAFRLNIVHPFL